MTNETKKSNRTFVDKERLKMILNKIELRLNQCVAKIFEIAEKCIGNCLI